MINEIGECASACLDTRKIALQTMRYCLAAGTRLAGAARLVRLLDCAQRCDAAAEACGKDADLAAHAAEACAKACEECAADCERFNEAEMRQCAEVCRYCAHACYRVVYATA